MSGGIDSTATCLMLQERGYEIVGVTMRVWGDEPQDARELAAQMGIEHYVADERIPFKETIVKNFIDEYKQGRTPNPCVMCTDGVGGQTGLCLGCYRTLFPLGREKRGYLYSSRR